MKFRSTCSAALAATSLPVVMLLAGCGQGAHPGDTLSPTASVSSLEQQLQQALASDQKQYGAKSEQAAEDLLKLGDVYRRAGKYADASSTLKQAIDIRKSEGADQSLALAKAENSYGLVLVGQGDFKQAEQVLLDAQSLRESHKATPSELADSQNSLGQLYFEGGVLAEAKQNFEKALPSIKTSDGENSVRYAEVQNNLASVYCAEGKFAQAEPMFQGSITAYETAIGHDQPEVADCLNNMAEAYSSEGKLAQAQTNYEEAIAIYKKISTPLAPHPNLSAALNNLALVYQKQKIYDKAEPLYKQAIKVSETANASNHADLASTLINYSSLLDATNRHTEAAAMAARVNTLLASK